MQLCKKHHFGIDRPEKLAMSPDDSKFLMKTLTQIKSNVAVPIKKKVVSDNAMVSDFTFFPPSSFYVLSCYIFHFFYFSFLLFSLPTCCLLFYCSTTQHPPTPTQYAPAFQVKESKERERMERRLLDELYKVFMDSDSFYYSMTYDLTNTVQRQGDSGKSDLPLWKQVSSLLTSRAHPHTHTHTNGTCTFDPVIYIHIK